MASTHPVAREAELREAAVVHARGGRPVFPLVPEKKLPTFGSNGHLDATSNPAVVRAMWELHPGAKIGMATGAKSGVVIIDSDPRHGGSVAGLHLTPTYTVRTAGGGIHYYYRHPGDGVRIPCSQSKLAPGVDVKGDGGFALLPPSRTEAGVYTEVDPEMPIADLPPDLLARLVAPAPQRTHEGRDPEAGTDGALIPEGSRNATLASLAGGMRRARMTVDEIQAALVAINAGRCTPPLPPGEVAKIAASIARYEPGRAAPAEMRERTAYYPVLTDEEAERLAPAEGILGDILFEDCIAYLYGDSDAWKTFVAVSWGLCIAADRAWLGHTVKPGPVVYVPAEGARGIGKRIRAWKQYHHIKASVDFYVVPMAVNLLDPEAIPRLMEDIEAHPRLAGRKPALIIFDTLARSMDGGDENETRDANRVTASVSLLKARWACCVLTLHHSGNAFTHRMRGNSAFRGNSDITIRVIAPPLAEGHKREPGDVVTLHSDKTKDAAGFDDIAITTALEEWTGDDGVSHSSLVVVASDQQPTQTAHAQPAIMPASSVTALRALPS